MTLKKHTIFAVGLNRWKHEFFRAIFPDERIFFAPTRRLGKAVCRAAMLFSKPKRILVWSYADERYAPWLADYAKKKNIPFIRVEDGFLRSVALGATHAAPRSLCFDDVGMYFNPQAPSALENICNGFPFHERPDLIAQAEDAMKAMLSGRLSKYNHVAQRDAKAVYGEKTRPRVLVVGQVEDDLSVKKGCVKAFTNNDLVRLAASENPDAEIIYKPHPDVLAGKREFLSDPKDVADVAKIVFEPMHLNDSFDTIDRVYVITSLAGFEAALRDIPVTVVGAPFYAGWGLTDDRQPTPRRTRALTKTELFAAAYLLYPEYYDIKDDGAIEKTDILQAIDALLTHYRQASK